MGWGAKKIIEYVDKVLTDKMVTRLKNLGSKVDTNREQIDILELIAIDKKIDALEKEIDKSIVNPNNLVCQDAPQEQQDELSENLDNHLIP